MAILESGAGSDARPVLYFGMATISSTDTNTCHIRRHCPVGDGRVYKTRVSVTDGAVTAVAMNVSGAVTADVKLFPGTLPCGKSYNGKMNWLG